jgi:hypothetical protein
MYGLTVEEKSEDVLVKGTIYRPLLVYVPYPAPTCPICHLLLLSFCHLFAVSSLPLLHGVFFMNLRPYDSDFGFGHEEPRAPLS